MTHGCPIDNFVTNSMIVHAESDDPTGTYSLAPIRSKEQRASSKKRDAQAGGPAPNASVLVAPFATCAHTCTWKEAQTHAYAPAPPDNRKIRVHARFLSIARIFYEKS